MKTRQYARQLALAALAGCFALTPALAATPGDPVTETPAFSNPVQAQRAARLAEQAALQTSTALQSSLRQVDAAEQRMEQALATQNQAEIMAARSALEQAQQQYARHLSEMTGVMTDDIERMRENGMGWGQIAVELGVHPGEVGMGHHRGERDRDRGMAPHSSGTARGRHPGIDPDEMAEATARDMESGWSGGGHGGAMGGAVGMEGQGEGHGGGPSGSGGGGHGGSSGSGGPGGSSGSSGHGGSGSAGGGMGGGSSSGGACDGMGGGSSSGGAGGGMGDGGAGGHGGGAGGGMGDGGSGGGGGGGRH